MGQEELDRVFDAGLDTWRAVLTNLEDRGLSAGLASSALAVAVGGALVSEGITPEQFIEIVSQTIRLWSRDSSLEGPVLVFSRPLLPDGVDRSEGAGN